MNTLDGLDDELLAAPKPSDMATGMSWREFQWRMGDKIFDDARIRAGRRPMPRDKREEALRKYMEAR